MKFTVCPQYSIRSSCKDSPATHSVLSVSVCPDRQHMILFQHPGNLRWTVAIHAEGKDAFDHLCHFRIDEPAFRIIWVFDIGGHAMRIVFLRKAVKVPLVAGCKFPSNSGEYVDFPAGKTEIPRATGPGDRIIALSFPALVRACAFSADVAGGDVAGAHQHLRDLPRRCL